MSARKKLPEKLTILIVPQRINRGGGCTETVRVGYLVEFGEITSGRNDRAITSTFMHVVRSYNTHGGKLSPMADADVAKLRADNAADITEISWRTRDITGSMEEVNG